MTSKVHADTASSAQEIHELVVVGSGGVGKSCMTVRFLKDEFTNDYDPTIEENYRKSITVDNAPCIVNIVDTAGQHEYTALRDQHLQSGTGFLLVFALNDKGSFEDVKGLREQILKVKDSKKVPMLIVGNKCDIPSESREVDARTVQAYCQGLRIPFLETSAKNNINVTEAYHELVRECRKKKADPGREKSAGAKKGGKKDKKSMCTIL